MQPLNDTIRAKLLTITLILSVLNRKFEQFYRFRIRDFSNFTCSEPKILVILVIFGETQVSVTLASKTGHIPDKLEDLPHFFCKF